MGIEHPTEANGRPVHESQGQDANTQEDKLSLEQQVQRRTQQLEKAKREWEQTFDAIDEPVLILDTAYQIQRANLKLARVVNKDIRDLIGQTCYRELVGRSSPCPTCPMHNPQQEQKRATEIKHVLKRAIYNVRSFPMPGNDQWYVNTYSDITEEKEIQQKLIESEKLNHIGMLAGQVAHELNNPLAGILAQAQMLLADLDPEANEDIWQSIKDIEEASLRCRKIIMNLLNFSRQSPTDRREKQQLNRIIQRTIPLYRMTPPRPGPQLIVELQPDLPELQLDTEKLQSVVLNLLCNAKAATPKQGEIRIATSAKDGCVELLIADTGEGIPKEAQADIFKPFYTTKPKGLGTGLGLYIVEEIVHAHNGNITLESQLGEGTTFHISLPLT